MNVASKLPKDIRGENYTGAATCVKCHSDISQNYSHSTHGLTSKPVVDEDLLKVFDSDSNSFSFNKHQKVKIEKSDKGIFQVAYNDGLKVKAERFDIAFGSGEKAFTYGYWKGKKLYELPLSYFSSINNWANSPGFPKNAVYYNRLITSRCFECHGSYIEKKLTQKSTFSTDEELEKGSVIYGIDCERCHGPGKEHVVFHMENPEEKTAKFITLFKNLSRKQRMDACGVCHSGNTLTSLKSVFKFKLGDDLASYYQQDFVGFGGGTPDVHGNQTTLLTGSNCYMKSENMTCQSCHNTHESIKGNMAVYSQRCISCHKTTNHSKITLAKGSVSINCIDCHMPKESSKLISFQQAGNDYLSPYLLRSHHIAIYSDQVNKNALH
ncbi:cytochrome c3 family protein [Pedobacter mucosus]|uniref:cytochrome c3 family protein n=1 Tax=Pedobacter mucosus TaxID=2895286 RepID=UPI001EE42E80|nr:cytochrome c3 family protein [Pedobacter mucosus]UKT62958.1 cytochrome c3 family protein [Pedobacter mucosus]